MGQPSGSVPSVGLCPESRVGHLINLCIGTSGSDTLRENPDQLWEIHVRQNLNRSISVVDFCPGHNTGGFGDEVSGMNPCRR